MTTKPRALLLGGPNGAAKSLSLALDSPELVELLLGAESTKKLSPGMAYRVLGWARRAVQLRANAVASIPWGIYRVGQDPKDADPLLSSDTPNVPPALAFLAGLGRLLPLWEASLTLEGCAFGLKLYDRGRPTGVQYWSPKSVRIDYDAAGGELGNGIGVIHHQLMVGPNQARYELPYQPHEVIHIFQPDPYVEAGPGSSDGASARTGADVLEGLQTFVDGYLDRGLVKATILSVPANTPPAERTRFEEWWTRFMAGKQNAGQQKVLNADAVTATPIGEGLKDLEAEKLVDAMREEVAAGFGVPYTLLKSQSANFATASVELASLYLHTSVPQAERVIAPAINEQMLLPAGLMLVFHPERLEALQAMELERASSVAELTGRPIFTVNEARQRMGLKPLDGAEFDTIHAPQPAVSISTGRNREDVADRDNDPNAQKRLAPFW